MCARLSPLPSNSHVESLPFRPCSLLLLPALATMREVRITAPELRSAVYGSPYTRQHSLSSGAFPPPKRNPLAFFVRRKTIEKGLAIFVIFPLSYPAPSQGIALSQNKGRGRSSSDPKVAEAQSDGSACQPFLHLQGRSHHPLPVRRGTPQM